MSTSARILADSLSPSGVRLITVECTLWRGVLAELNTHRAFARNSASTRAIPLSRQIELVESDPFIPSAFPVERPGMVSKEWITPEDELPFSACVDSWLRGRDDAVNTAKRLGHLGVHKQIAGRVLEPWMYHTAIITATDWDGFFEQRLDEAAQREIRLAAEAIQYAIQGSDPQELDYGQWHLPLIFDEDQHLTTAAQVMVSSARCAAVSYKRHQNRDIEKDLSRYANLTDSKPIHYSPLEHAATPKGGVTDKFGCLRGWAHARWHVENGVDLARTYD